MNEDERTYQTTDGRRYHYPGKKIGYPSVTTILKVWPSEYLEDWRIGNIAKQVVANSDTLYRDLKIISKKPERLKLMSYEELKGLFIEWKNDYTAADRGTRIHWGVEQVLTGEITKKKVLKKHIEPNEFSCVIAVLDKLKSMKFEPLYIEPAVYKHGKTKYAGRADLIGTYQKSSLGKKLKISCLIDLKTGKRYNRSYAPQIAAYVYADELIEFATDTPIKMPQVSQGIVLHAHQGGEAATLYKIDLKEAWEDFEACARIYKSSKSSKSAEVLEIRNGRKV